MTNTIAVTKCDNELIILAYQWGASFELCRILSGNFHLVNVTLTVQSGPYQGTMVLNGVNNPLNQAISVTLPPGAYKLLLLGIDWGGPAQFDVKVNGTEYQYPPTDSGDGLVFHPAPISITV